MYARVTTYQIRPEHHNAETEARMQAELPGQVEAIEGLRHAFWLSRPGDHSAIVVAIYESSEAARAAAGQVQQIWDNWMDMVDGRPHTETYDVTVAYGA